MLPHSTERYLVRKAFNETRQRIVKTHYSVVKTLGEKGVSHLTASEVRRIVDFNTQKAGNVVRTFGNPDRQGAKDTKHRHRLTKNQAIDKMHANVGAMSDLARMLNAYGDSVGTERKRLRRVLRAVAYRHGFANLRECASHYGIDL